MLPTVQKILFQCGINSNEINSLIDYFSIFKSNENIENANKFWNQLISLLPTIIEHLDLIDDSIDNEISIEIHSIDRNQLYRHFLLCLTDRLLNDDDNNNVYSPLIKKKILIQYIIDKLSILPKDTENNTKDILFKLETIISNNKVDDIVIINSLKILLERYSLSNLDNRNYNNENNNSNIEISKITSDYILHIIDLFNLDYLNENDQYINQITKKELLDHLVTYQSKISTDKVLNKILKELLVIRDISYGLDFNLKNYSFINKLSILISTYSILYYFLKKKDDNDITKQEFEKCTKMITDRQISSLILNRDIQHKDWLSSLQKLLLLNDVQQINDINLIK